MSADWLGVEGRRCVVTGAGGGLGRAIALAFARAGARVLCLDHNEDAAGQIAHDIRHATGHPAHSVAADVSDPDSVARAVAQGEALNGPTDILVNNAALLRPGPLASLSLAEWNALIGVNLTGYFLCAQGFGRGMRARGGGAMVHVASISGANPQPQSGAYSVSKAGVVMLSRQIAMEWGPEGVRSNVVSPGMVETPMSRGFYDAPGVRARREGVVPSRRIGQPEDIAEATLFLASPRSAYVNGEDILVDGGYSTMLMGLIPRPGFD